MNRTQSQNGLAVCFLVLACTASESAMAIAGVARRHVVVGTATVVAVSSANATAAATANANAQAAAAKPPPPVTPAGPPAVGSITTTLPAGCAPAKLNNVEYQRCGGTYYRATMQGSNLVYVVSQP